MTENHQDVDLNVVTPSLPAVRVCPEPLVRDPTSNCAQPALYVAAELSTAESSTSKVSSSCPLPSSSNTHEQSDNSKEDLTSINDDLCEDIKGEAFDVKNNSTYPLASNQSEDTHFDLRHTVKVKDCVSYSPTSDESENNNNVTSDNNAICDRDNIKIKVFEVNDKSSKKTLLLDPSLDHSIKDEDGSTWKKDSVGGRGSVQTSDVTNSSTGTPSAQTCSIFDSVADSEGNQSVSTDETLHNSDSDSSSFTNKVSVKVANMGNQSSNKKAVQSDDDTPDETKTKCCEIPKKKVKDRLSKASRSSKSGEDFDFEDDELYPFEGRTRSEREIVDPVELEPFEIIETDDIKFIPGAGTSDVIKSASESKFKTIPEEESVDGDEKFDTFIVKHDPTLEHERNAIDKDDGIQEPGTSTTTSTFEFKPAKSKAKAAKQKAKENKTEPMYENVKSVSTGSTETSRQNSSSSSNDISRKNSKEGIQKPLRKNSKKASETSKEKQANDNKEKIEKIKSKQTQESSEKNKDGPFVLKQTMFSTPNPEEVDTKAKVLNENKNISQNSYENVNVGVKFGPMGITICNKNSQNVLDASNDNAARSKQSLNVDNEIVNGVPKTCHPVVASSSNTSTIGRPESPLYETLIPESKEPTVDKEVGQVNTANLEAVPPPSPLALDILEEEEEETDEDEVEEEDDIIEEENKRKSAIIEFTETVCKRLSQLLDDQPTVSEEKDNDNEATAVIEHIYETVTKDNVYSVPIAKNSAIVINSGIEINHKTDVTIETKPVEDIVISPEIYQKIKTEKGSDIQTDTDTRSGDTFDRSPKREDSSSTLKRTSGDSVTYPPPDILGSSDDDLPEYFDPKGVHPKRDSEILCDVLDAYSEEVITAVSAKEVADIVDAHTLDFNQYIQGHSTNKADKNLALPLQTFDDSLISKAPNTNSADEIQDRTPVAEVQPELTALHELANANVDVQVQYNTSGRQSESDLDISEHRDDLSTDSMLADDEDEETMEILFTKTYTEPVQGGEVFLSCTVVNSAYKDEHKKSETWLSDEALEYFEANAADVMSTAFMKARKEMKDIQVCLQSLRKQMEHFHGDYDDISLPDIPVDALSPCDYYGLSRKAVTD